jgi:hypothetical protein
MDQYEVMHGALKEGKKESGMDMKALESGEAEC